MRGESIFGPIVFAIGDSGLTVLDGQSRCRNDRFEGYFCARTNSDGSVGRKKQSV